MATDLSALRSFTQARKSYAAWKASRARPNPSGGYTRDGVVADVVNRAALETAPWAPNTGKVFISDVYNTIVRQGADDGVSLDELKHDLVRLHQRGLLELARADLVAAMPHGKVAASETDAGGATYHFIVRPRQNPYVGSHPDLFGPSTHDQYQRRPGPVHDKPHTLALHLPIDPAAQRAKRAAGPESPIFVPLSDLTSEQIRELKRAQFTEPEWEELDEDDREYIIENDEESQARVEALAEPFISRWKWETNYDGQRSERDLFSYVEDVFESDVRAQAMNDSFANWLPQRTRDALYRLAQGQDADEGDIDRYLTDIMSDANAYTFTADGNAPGYTAWSWEIGANFYIERNDFEDAMDECTPDEIERACELIKDETNHDIPVTPEILAKKQYIEYDRFDTGVTVYAKIEPGWVEDRVRDMLDADIQEREREREESADQFEDPQNIPEEARIVYRWKDGFYVLDLLPSELPEEGKAMGMCVGRPDMGYGRAVQRGEIAILSVRRPSGKPLFTIEAAIKRTTDGKFIIDEIVQVKGKANRLPGFDLGKTAPGTPLKKDEVVRIYELIEGPDGLGKFDLNEAVDDIQDLKPAAREVNRLFSEGDKWATDLLIRLGIEERPMPIGAVQRATEPRENPGPACGLHDEKCTGFCRPYRRRR